MYKNLILVLSELLSQCGVNLLLILVIISFRSTRSRELQINFLEGLGFQVNNINFVNRDNAVFFSDLTNVKAWFGGVNESALNM